MLCPSLVWTDLRRKTLLAGISISFARLTLAMATWFKCADSHIKSRDYEAVGYLVCTPRNIAMREHDLDPRSGGRAWGQTTRTNNLVQSRPPQARPSPHVIVPLVKPLSLWPFCQCERSAECGESDSHHVSWYAFRWSHASTS